MKDELETIDLGALDGVTGGRFMKGDDPLKPQVLQALQALKEAVAGGLQAIANQKQAKDGQMMQMFGEMMKKKQGG